MRYYNIIIYISAKKSKITLDLGWFLSYNYSCRHK